MTPVTPGDEAGSLGSPRPFAPAHPIGYGGAMSLAMQIVYRIRKAVRRLLRLSTRGAQVMVFNPKGEILLVRNSYGPNHLFVLPGGGIGRNETPEAAAAREVKEEVGLDVRRLARVSRHAHRGRAGTVYLFTAEADGAPRSDSFEIEEARFFALDALPPNVSSPVLRRIAERRGERTPDGSW